MNTPTPETDAETMRDEWDHVDSDFGPFGPSDSVPADFARKLERERDEARETIAATLRSWQTAQEKIIAVTKERDEARAEMAAIKAMLLDPVEVELDMIRGNIAIPARPEFGGVYDTGKAMANLIRERDEARGQRDRLAEASKSLLRHIKQIRSGDSPLVHPLLIESMDNSAAKLDAALQSLTPNESISNQ